MAYRVVIADLDGTPREEVPPRAAKLTRVLNDAGSFEFEVLKKTAKATRELLEPGQRQILIADGSIRRFGGYLYGASGGSDDDVVKFGGPGWFAGLSDRYVDTADRVYDDVEQFDIAWDLIDWTQGKMAGADLGITRWAGEVDSGVLRTAIYKATERPMIDEILKTLAGADDGFDFEVDPDQVWKAHHPAAGAASEAAFVARKNLWAYHYQVDASAIVTDLTAIGGALAITAASWSGVDDRLTFTAKAHGSDYAVGDKVTIQGMKPDAYNKSAAPIVVVTADTFKVAGPAVNPGAATEFGTVTLDQGPKNILQTASDAVARARYRLRERAITFSDVHVNATLDALADATLGAMVSPSEQPQLTARIDDLDSALGAFDLGDTARVQISDGYFDLDDTFRVVGITIELTPAGQVRAAVAFDKRIGAKWIRGRNIRHSMDDLMRRVSRLEGR